MLHRRQLGFTWRQFYLFGLVLVPLDYVLNGAVEVSGHQVGVVLGSPDQAAKLLFGFIADHAGQAKLHRRARGRKR